MKNTISATQSAFEAEILSTLFDWFSTKNVRYAVLRNYELLPESVGARDIDMVVHPDDLMAACTTVNDIATSKA